MKNSIGNEIAPLNLTVVQKTKHVEAMRVKYDFCVLPNFIKKYAPITNNKQNKLSVWS